MNTDIHIEEPLRKRPFPKGHDETVLFWSDKASCHHAGRTLQFLSKNSVVYVKKRWNLMNVLQLGPIETFWSNLKVKVYSDVYKANPIDEIV